MTTVKIKSTKELARELGLLRKRSSSSAAQCLKRIKRNKQEFAYLIVIDFESTCWENVKYKPQEIIEFPAVLLNTATGGIESEFHHYLQPQENPYLSDFCQQLTGITQDQVDQGIPLFLTLKRFATWLRVVAKDRNISYQASSSHDIKCSFVTWSDWDLGVCLQYEVRRKQLRKPAELDAWIDLRATYRNFYQRRPQGLNGALQDLGISFEGREHSGLCDARNTAKLAWRMMTDGCMLHVTKTLTSPLTSRISAPPPVRAPLADSMPGLPSSQMSSTTPVSHPAEHLVRRQQSEEDPSNPQHTLIGRKNSGQIKSAATAAMATPVAEFATEKQEALSGNVETMQQDCKANNDEGNQPIKEETIDGANFNALTSFDEDTWLMSEVIDKLSADVNQQPLCSKPISSCTLQNALSRVESISLGQQKSCTTSNGLKPTSDQHPQTPSCVCKINSNAPEINSNEAKSSNRPSVTPRVSMIKPQTTSSEGQVGLSAVKQPIPSKQDLKAPAAVKHDAQGCMDTAVRSGPISYKPQSACRGPQEQLTRPKSTPAARIGHPENGHGYGQGQGRGPATSFSIYSDPPGRAGSRLLPASHTLFKTPATRGATELSSTQVDTDRLPLTLLGSANCSTPLSGRSSTSSISATLVAPPSGTSGKRTPPMCGCGRRAHRKLVQSPGPNQGRAFYACPAGGGRRGPGDGRRLLGGVRRQQQQQQQQKQGCCGFFKWESSVNSSSNTSLQNVSCSSSSGSFLYAGYGRAERGVGVARRTQSFLIPPLAQPDFNTPGTVQKHTKDTKNTLKTLGAGGPVASLALLRY